MALPVFVEMLTVFSLFPAGSKQERGILAWNKAHEDDSCETLETGEVYNLPFGLTSYLSSFSWLRYVPFCPPGLSSSLDPKQPLGTPDPGQIMIGVGL